MPRVKKFGQTSRRRETNRKTCATSRCTIIGGYVGPDLRKRYCLRHAPKIKVMYKWKRSHIYDYEIYERVFSTNDIQKRNVMLAWNINNNLKYKNKEIIKELLAKFEGDSRESRLKNFIKYGPNYINKSILERIVARYSDLHPYIIRPVYLRELARLEEETGISAKYTVPDVNEMLY